MLLLEFLVIKYHMFRLGCCFNLRYLFIHDNIQYSLYHIPLGSFIRQLLLLKLILLHRVVLEMSYFVKVNPISTLPDDVV